MKSYIANHGLSHRLLNMKISISILVLLLTGVLVHFVPGAFGGENKEKMAEIIALAPKVALIKCTVEETRSEQFLQQMQAISELRKKNNRPNETRKSTALNKITKSAFLVAVSDRDFLSRRGARYVAETDSIEGDFMLSNGFYDGQFWSHHSSNHAIGWGVATLESGEIPLYARGFSPQSSMTKLIRNFGLPGPLESVAWNSNTFQYSAYWWTKKHPVIATVSSIQSGLRISYEEDLSEGRTRNGQVDYLFNDESLLPFPSLITISVTTGTPGRRLDLGVTKITMHSVDLYEDGQTKLDLNPKTMDDIHASYELMYDGLTAVSVKTIDEWEPIGETDPKPGSAIRFVVLGLSILFGVVLYVLAKRNA